MRFLNTLKLKKTVSLITAFCFISASAPVDAYSFAPSAEISSGLISSAYGKIIEKEFFDSPEIVINIQDLHCNPEVQRNIALLIQEINDKYGIDGIYAEGGYGDVNTGWTDGVENKDDKLELLNVLLGSGRLTGAEYYSALNDKHDIIKGIEDEDVHRQNIIRLNEILSRQDYYKSKLKEFDKELSFMRAKYLGLRNKRFDRITAEYKSGKIGMPRYYALLKKYSKTFKEINLQKYPNILRYIKTNELRGKLDYPEIQRQLEAFVRILKEKLPYSAYSDISAKTGNFANIGDLYFYAGQIVKKYGIELGRGFSELNLFFRYEESENAINPKEMLEEENNLSQEIRIAFSKDIDEIETAFLSYFYPYFEGYLTNSLTASDYKYFVKKFGDFKYLWDKYNYESGLKDLQKDFDVLDEYYRVNNERDAIFVGQLQGVLPANGKDKAAPLNISHSEIQNKLKKSKVYAVITGGFHSGGLKDLLKERGVSCITVMPNVSGISDTQEIYESLVVKQAVKMSSPVQKSVSERASEKYSLALALGSTDARIKYENGIYIVNINGEILEIFKNELTNKFEIKDFSKDAGFEDAVNNALIGRAVKENILSGIEKIRALSSPAGSAELIYWLVKDISKSGKINSVLLGDGLIWKIASNPEVQRAIRQNEGFSPNEINLLPEIFQNVIANHAVLKEKFKDNSVICAVLNTPEFETILAVISDKFKIRNYLTLEFGSVKKYFDGLVSVAAVRAKTKARDVRGYEEYGGEVVNYYKQRLNLLNAARTADMDIYQEAYNSLLKSAQTVKSAFLSRKLDLQLLMEVFERDGTLNRYAIDDAYGAGTAVGPWYEIISSAGEEFDEESVRRIDEAVNMLISAFPENQRAGVAALRDELIKNTKPHGFSSMVWSPEQMREIFSKVSPLQYQAILESFSRTLGLASDFEKYGNLGYTAADTDTVYMHSIENKELFMSVYVHELIHSLANKKIIDIPFHIETLTQAVSALLYYSTNVPEEIEMTDYAAFDLGKKNAAKITGELTGAKLNKFMFDLISANWQELGYSSVQDAFVWLNAVMSGAAGDTGSEMFQRMTGTAIAGILWDRNKNISDSGARKQKALSDALSWADKVLSEETSSVPKYFPDTEKRKRITDEIQELIRNMSGNRGFTLKEKDKTSDNADDSGLFAVSKDGNTIYYDPLLLDYPDEEAAKALFLEQLSVVRFSKPVQVEAEYDNSRFYLLMSTLELIRTRRDNFKGKINADLIKVLYPNPDSESAKRIMSGKSLFAQYIEGLLFTARTGRDTDPRIENPLVLKALEETKQSVGKIAGLGVIGNGIPETVYETAKTEIWPKLSGIIAESEKYLREKKLKEAAEKEAARKQMQENINSMLERMRKQKEQNDAQSGQQMQPGQAQLTPGSGGQPLTQEQARQFQEMLENMNEEQKREFDGLMKDLMRDEIDNMLSQQSGGYSQSGKQASKNEKRGERYDKMQGQADSAKDKTGKLGQTQREISETIEQLRQEIEKLEKSAKDIESKSGSGSDMTQDSGRLGELSEQLQAQGEELSQEMSDVRNGTQQLKSQGGGLGESEAKSAEGVQSSSDDLYQKGRQLDKGVKEFEEKMKELQDKIQKLQELLSENKNVPSQRNQAGEVEKGAQDLRDNVSQIQQLNDGLGDSLRDLQEQLEAYKREIEQLKRRIGKEQEDSSGNKESSSGQSDDGQPSQSGGQSSEDNQSSHSDAQERSGKRISEASKKMADSLKSFSKPKNKQIAGAAQNVKDRTAEMQNTMLSSSRFNEMLKILEPFRRPADELAGEIKREMQKTVDDEYLEGMDSGELSDDFSRLADGKIFKKMLVRGSGEHRVMVVIDNSGSMGNVEFSGDGTLINNGSSMYGTLKMLITVLLALKEIDGIEIGVMMYGDVANLLDITKSKDVTDEAVYLMVKALADGYGGTDDVPTLRSAVEKISSGGEGIFKSILHISDGGGYGRKAVQEFYRENSENGIKFVSYGIGLDTQLLEKAYSPSGEIVSLYPQGLEPAAKTVGNAEDLLGEMAKFIEDMFRDERDETMVFGKNAENIITAVLEGFPSIWTRYVKEKFGELNGGLKDLASGYAQKLVKFLLEGRHKNWLLKDGEAQRKYGEYLPSAEVQNNNGYAVMVSKAPLDLTVADGDNYVFATINLNGTTGVKEIIIHQSVLEWIKNNGPPRGYSPQTFIEEQLIRHELDEYEFVQIRQSGNYEDFHRLTWEQYKPLFELGDSVAKGDNSGGNITFLGYVNRDEKKYLIIKNAGRINPVEAAVDGREDSPNRVKLYIKENGGWKEFSPGGINGVPDLIGYSVGNSDRINSFRFTDGNRDLLRRMIAAYGKPDSDVRNTNIWLEGEKGSGKNALSFVFAGLLGIPARFVSLHANTTQKDISERTIIAQGTQEIEIILENGEAIKAEIPAGVTRHEFSEIYRAAQKGELVIIDEVDKVKLEGVLSALNTILTRERIGGLVYDAGFRVIMLSNDHLSGDVSGNDLNRKNRDLLSRMTKIKVGYPEFGEEYERIMDSIYGDLADGSEEKEILSGIMTFLITLAGWSRDRQNGRYIEYDGQKLEFPKLSKSISPRTIIKIAKHLHPDNYFNDIEYLGSLIDSAFGTDSLSDKERERFNAFLSQVAVFKRFNKTPDFTLGYDSVEDAAFEYSVENGAVYASLGKDEWQVRIKTAIDPENIEEARKRLKSQYRLPDNMLLFWQWMKDISLGENLMVLGVPGTGKTVLTDYLLNTVLGLDAPLMQMNVQSSGTDLLGEWGLVNGIQVFNESLLVSAMREGKPVIIDEADKPRDETALAVLNNILQDGFVVLPNDGRSEEERTVFAKEGFFAVTVGNLAAKGGTASTRISGEVMDRHSVYVAEALPKEQTAVMLERYAQANGYEVPEGIIEKITEVHYKIMDDKDITQKPSMRTLEKTIGTLARDASRLDDIASVYLEGYSLNKKNIKKIMRFFIQIFGPGSDSSRIAEVPLAGLLISRLEEEPVKAELLRSVEEHSKSLSLSEWRDFDDPLDDKNYVYITLEGYPNQDLYMRFDEDAWKIFKRELIDLISYDFPDIDISYVYRQLELTEKEMSSNYNTHTAVNYGRTPDDLGFLRKLLSHLGTFISAEREQKKVKHSESDSVKQENPGPELFYDNNLLVISGVSAAVDNRRNEDPDGRRRVKLFLSGEENAQEVFAGDLDEIPETVYYQIGGGEKVPFTFTNGNKELLKRMLAAYGKPESDARNTNLWLEGQKGGGKNALSFVFAGLLGVPMRFVSLHANTTQKDISERTILSKGYKKVKAKTAAGRTIEADIPASITIKQFSEIYEAAKNGELVIIDEVDKVKLDGVLSALNTVLTRDNIKGLKYDPRFRVIVLSNDHETRDVSGKDLNVRARDFISRLTKIEVPYPSNEEEIQRIMGSVFGDLAKDGKEYKDFEELIAFIAGLAKLTRESKSMSGSLSPRSVFKIARHLRKFPQDKKYLKSVISKYYGTEILSEKEDFDLAFSNWAAIFGGYKNMNIGKEEIAAAKMGYEDIKEAEFEYSVSNGTVYVSLGKGEHKITVPSGIKPEDINKAKAGLAAQYHVYDNMLLFWQWMKDILLEDNIMVLGVPGTGKTVLTNYLLNNVLGYSADMQTLSVQTSGTDLFGEWSLQGGEQVFTPSLIVEAMEAGRPVIIDEIDKPRDETALAALNNILQSGFVTLPDGKVIHAKKGFFIVCAGNLPGKGGTASTRISGEVTDRHSVYIMDALSKGQTVEMLSLYAESNGYSMPDGFIEKLAELHRKIMSDDSIKQKPSIRTLEKTIGALARDPSRFDDVAGVYLEGFSLSSASAKKKIAKMADNLFPRGSVFSVDLDYAGVTEMFRKVFTKMLSREMPSGFEMFSVTEWDKDHELYSVTAEKFNRRIANPIRSFLSFVEETGYTGDKIEKIRSGLKEISEFSSFDMGDGYPDEYPETSETVSDIYDLLKDFKEYTSLLVNYKTPLEDFEKIFESMLSGDGLQLNVLGGAWIGTLSSGNNHLLYVKAEGFEKMAGPVYKFLEIVKSAGYDDSVIEKIRESLKKLAVYQSTAEDRYDTKYPDTTELVSDIKALINSFAEYSDRNKRTQTDIKVSDSRLYIGDVSAPIGTRKKDARRVKLFLSGEENAQEVFAGDLDEIPETVYYQIGGGEKVPFTFTSGNKELLKRMLAAYGKPESDARNTNLWLEGQTGSGKNALSFVFAGLLGVPMRFVSLHANTTQKDISERSVIDTEEKVISATDSGGKKIKVKIPLSVTKKQFSEIYEAAKNGELVIIDEVDKVKLDGVLSALNTVLTRDNIKGLKYDPRFRVIVLSNNHETRDVSGKDLNVRARDFISRLTKIEVPYPSKEEEIQRVMGSVFGDLTKDGKEYNETKLIIDDIVTVAVTIRNSKVLTRPLSPRSVFRIARHIKAYPQDKEYLYSLIDASYGAETLSLNEQKEFKKILNNILRTKGLNNEYPKDFSMGYDNPGEAGFEYSADRGITYVSLGKGEYRVTIPTKINPKDIEKAKAGLKEQYHIPANMALLRQWMKDISLGDNIMVLGVPGTGKTVLTSYLLNDVLGLQTDLMQLNVQSSGTDLFGEWGLENGRMVFKDSLVTQAMQSGKPVIIDEIDKPRDETALAALNNILQSGFVTLPDGRVIHAKKGFFIVCAGNLPNKGGTASTRISGEVMNRHSVYILKELPQDQIADMLKKYAVKNNYNVPDGFIEALADFHMRVANEPSLPYQPNMRTLEKIIGTLARDPSRYYDIAGVYLEGFSLKERSQEFRVRQIAQESPYGGESFDALSKQFALLSEKIDNVPAGTLKKLNYFREKFDKSGKHRSFTDIEFFGLLKQVSLNGGDALGAFDYAVKTLGLQESGAEAVKDIENLYFEVFLDEILEYETENKSDREKIIEIAGALGEYGEIDSFESLGQYQSMLEYYKPENLGLLKKLPGFLARFDFEMGGDWKIPVTDALLKLILKDGDVTGIYDYASQSISSNSIFANDFEVQKQKTEEALKEAELQYFLVFLEDILEYEVKNESDREKIKQFAEKNGEIASFETLRQYQSALEEEPRAKEDYTEINLSGNNAKIRVYNSDAPQGLKNMGFKVDGNSVWAGTENGEVVLYTKADGLKVKEEILSMLSGSGNIAPSKSLQNKLGKLFDSAGKKVDFKNINPQFAVNINIRGFDNIPPAPADINPVTQIRNQIADAKLIYAVLCAS
ncbi:MAG: AAA family ATPase [Endomicrobium sp.]|jgi:MoxR-like ATPase|nr:AAA family ATPase [Endomicrobium sp.]